MYSADQLTVKMINELYRLENQIEDKKKTIVLYDLFANRQDHAVQLNNLHVCAQVMLDQDLNVDIVREEDEEGNSTVMKYVVAEKQVSQKKIIKRVFEIELAPEGQEPYLDNIWIYDLEGGDTRVVVIPIQEDMIDTDIIRKEAEADKEEDIKVKQSFKDKGLQNEELKKANKDWEAIKNERFVKRCAIARQKHIKMFRIEALIGTVLQKTEKVSIACFVEICERRFKDLNGFMNEFPGLFSVPADFIPQYVVHKFTNKNKKLAPICEKDQISSIFSTNDGKFGIKKFETLDQKYFFCKDNIRTKMYENMEKNDNEAIKFVIQEFVGNFNRIAVESSLVFATVVNKALSALQEESSSEDQNNSLQVSSCKEIGIMSSFDEVFEKYISSSLWLPTVVELDKFYTPKRLQNIHVQQGHPMIPRSIENLVFIHYFYKIGREFLEKYVQRDIEVKGSQVELLKLWKDGLKQVYSLVNEANVTFLQLQENEEYRCKDITRFFNFVIFTIESLEKIKKITKRDIPTASELKSNFEALKFKKESILSYIIKNQNRIKKQQPIHYYDLLLLIIEENASKDVAKDMEYIFLHIHELKAYLIATNYIYDIEKVIAAIKSYALIVRGYVNLSPNKRELIEIVTIFKRLARLLKVAGLEEEAAAIYTKLREMEFTDKCYSTILAKSSLSGDEKAEKLLVWGKIFEAEFEYDLALKYYRKAFSFAKQIPIKQRALKSKIDCNTKMRTGPTEEELRMHDNFLSDGDYLTYISKVEINKMLKNIRKKLKWDSKSKTSMIMAEDDSEYENPDSSFINTLENGVEAQSATEA